MGTTTRDEHPVGLIDPHLLHRVVVEELLQRTEAGYLSEDLPDHDLGLIHRTHCSGEAATIMLGDDIQSRASDRRSVGARVNTTFAHEIAHLIGNAGAN